MKATVLYYSHKGKTALYARQIAMYLWSKGWNVTFCAITEFDEQKLCDTDFLCLGCWTSGWFVIHQHPHERWKAKAKKIASFPLPTHICLFTTFKFRTGSMFRAMRKTMNIPKENVHLCLSSKNGLLSEQDKQKLDEMLTFHFSTSKK